MFRKHKSKSKRKQDREIIDNDTNEEYRYLGDSGRYRYHCDEQQCYGIDGIGQELFERQGYPPSPREIYQCFKGFTHLPQNVIRRKDYQLQTSVIPRTTQPQVPERSPNTRLSTFCRKEVPDSKDTCIPRDTQIDPSEISRIFSIGCRNERDTSNYECHQSILKYPAKFYSRSPNASIPSRQFSYVAELNSKLLQKEHLRRHYSDVGPRSCSTNKTCEVKSTSLSSNQCPVNKSNTSEIVRSISEHNKSQKMQYHRINEQDSNVVNVKSYPIDQIQETDFSSTPSFHENTYGLYDIGRQVIESEQFTFHSSRSLSDDSTDKTLIKTDPIFDEDITIILGLRSNSSKHSDCCIDNRPRYPSPPLRSLAECSLSGNSANFKGLKTLEAASSYSSSSSLSSATSSISSSQKRSLPQRLKSPSPTCFPFPDFPSPPSLNNLQVQYHEVSHIKRTPSPPLPPPPQFTPTNPCNMPTAANAKILVPSTLHVAEASNSISKKTVNDMELKEKFDAVQDNSNVARARILDSNNGRNDFWNKNDYRNCCKCQESFEVSTTNQNTIQHSNECPCSGRSVNNRLTYIDDFPLPTNDQCKLHITDCQDIHLQQLHMRSFSNDVLEKNFRKGSEMEVEIPDDIDISQCHGLVEINEFTPNWKREMMKKKNNEKIEEYIKSILKQRELEAKWKNVPEWKRALLMKKDMEEAIHKNVETPGKAPTPKTQTKVGVPQPPPKPKVDIIPAALSIDPAELESMPPWKRELLFRREKVPITFSNEFNPDDENIDDGVSHVIEQS